MSAFPSSDHRVEVCVVGGGMPGLRAAVASARQVERTLLVQDRPVLGGNASSEVRMWICGAHGKDNKESGLLEEVQLDNARLNPAGNDSIWDAVMWNFASRQPNLTLLLNCEICDGYAESVASDASLRRLTQIRGLPRREHPTADVCRCQSTHRRRKTDRRGSLVGRRGDPRARAGGDRKESEPTSGSGASRCLERCPGPG